MEVKIKNIVDKKLKKDYQIIVPFSSIELKINDSVAKIKKNINLKGFRKGHVPNDVIKQKYGTSIMADESDKIISDQINKIVKDNNFKLALQPKIDVKTFEDGKDVELTASFEIFPEIPEIDLNKIKIVKKEFEVTEKEIEEAINNITKYFRKLNKQEDPNHKTKLGDFVNIDYIGY